MLSGNNHHINDLNCSFIIYLTAPFGKNYLLKMCIIFTCSILSSLCETVSTFHTNSLTDCNGVLVDVNRSQQSGSDKYNSTALFSLSTFPVSIGGTYQ